MFLRGLRCAIALLPLLVFATCGGGSDSSSNTVTPVPSVSLSPSTASVKLGGKVQFTGSVTGTTNHQVTWQVNGTTGGSETWGTISATGLYTAPATMPSSSQVTIKVILAADTTKFKTATVTLVAPASYRIVGYMPDWSGDVSEIQYDKLTHICYAFLLAKADGSLNSTGISISRLQQLVTLAHSHGVKVLISLGGWNNSSILTSAMRDTTARAALAANCLAFVDQYSLDGLDFDWEGFESDSDGVAWGAFMQTMHTALQAKGKLTTTALAQWFGSHIQAGSLAYADFINVMAYDDAGSQHSSYDLAVSQMTYWHGRGVGWDKLVLGVPFYGYTSDGSRLGSSTYTYRQICADDPDAQNSDSSTGVNAIGVNYNGIPTIQKKSNYVVSQGAGGVMMWELSQDATGSKSLLSAIHGVLSAN